MSLNLPVCNNIKPIFLDEERTYSSKNRDEYKKLCEIIENYIGGDCRAFIVNDEEIFNSYDENKTFVQKLTEDGFRIQIMKNCHSTILVELNRGYKDARIDIYMFPFEMAYRVQIDYNASNCEYSIQIFYSEGYQCDFPSEFNENYIAEDEVEKNRNLAKIQMVCISSETTIRDNQVIIETQNSEDYLTLYDGLEKYYPKLDKNYYPTKNMVTITNLPEESYIYLGAIQKGYVKWMKEYIQEIEVC